MHHTNEVCFYKKYCIIQIFFFFIKSDLMIFGFYPAEVCQMFVMAAVKVMAVKNYKNAYNEKYFVAAF